MADRAAHPEVSPVKKEPVGVSEAIRVVLVLLVGAGWLTFDDATINTIVSIVGVAISNALTWWTRGQVSPVAKPRGRDGVPLAPIPSSTIGGDAPSQT